MTDDRDTIVSEVMADTKRTDKQTALEGYFEDALIEMSQAKTEDGEPILLQDLKEDESYSIVSGDYFKALPTDFVYMYSRPELRYDTDKGRLLIKKDREWMDWNYPNRANNTTNKSKPSYFSLEAGRFDFAPMSDNSYTIIFPHTKLHPVAANNITTILYGDRFKTVIKDLLKSKLWDLLEDFDKRDFHFNRGMTKLRAAAIIDKRNASDILITNYSDL